MVSPRQGGFTLTELMAVLGILAVLSAMAAPSFSGVVATVRARGASSDLYAALSRARSEAVKRNAEVSLVPAASGKWQDGWRIPDPADDTRALDTHPALPNASVTGPTSVAFMPNGRVKGGSLPTFDIAIAGQAQHRCVSLDLGGRPNQTSSGC